MHDQEGGPRATIPALLADLARRHGDRAQVVAAGGTLSFKDVERRSAAMARGLLASGVGKGEKVGVLMPNGGDWVVAWCAAERIGAVAVLLSTFAKPRELAYMLRHADVRTLLASERFLNHDFRTRLTEALPGLSEQSGAQGLRLPGAPCLRDIWISAAQPPDWAAGDYRALEQPARGASFEVILPQIELEVTPADPALIFYTSGSTSDPKAVLHAHGAVVRQALAMASYMTYQPGDRCLTTQPFFWVGGLCTSLLAANIGGAALVCPATPAPESCLASLREQGVTHIALWPAQLAAILAMPEFTQDDFRRLRHTSAQQLGLFGLAPPELTPNSLGMSETFGPHSMEFPNTPLPADRTGSFGRAVCDVERKIVDPRTGETMAPGAVGELFVRGHALMMGFYKREPREAFEPDGYYRTGDLCSLSEDGYLFFTGRSGEMIKTSGANVSPREVELILLAQPGVLDAAVVGLPDPKLGELVVAAVVAAPQTELTESALQARLREQLSSYKVPKRIFVLEESGIPRTDSAKIRKPALKEVLAGLLGAPETRT
jgi:acyl-CoA synthetase (AMP-forming)/AMP-acid ligase II